MMKAPEDLFVTLDPERPPWRYFWFRRPRSRKRRIRNKWRKRRENWYAEPNIIQTTLAIGGGFRLADGSKPPEHMPVMLEMNPEAWADCERALRARFGNV